MAPEATRPAAPAPSHESAVPNDTPPSSNGRQPNGRFARGNRGGPGNPFARRVAELRCAFIGAVLPEDLQQIARRLITMAAMGDLAAAKLVLGYLLGKVPGPVDPDTLDQQECRLYQQNMSCTDIGEIVQHRPPPDMAAGILRCNEIANAERGHQLAKQIKEEDANRQTLESLEQENPDTTEWTEELAGDEQLREPDCTGTAEVTTDTKRSNPSRRAGTDRHRTVANGTAPDRAEGSSPLPIGGNGRSSRKEAMAQPSTDGSIAAIR